MLLTDQYVGDLAKSAVAQAGGGLNEIVNAIGPETFTYHELVEMVKRTLGVRRLVIGVPPDLGYLACRAMGLAVGDVVITRQEIAGLTEGRLFVAAPPLGTTNLTEWVERNKRTLGRRYTSEMARRVDRHSP